MKFGNNNIWSEGLYCEFLVVRTKLFPGKHGFFLNYLVTKDSVMALQNNICKTFLIDEYGSFYNNIDEIGLEQHNPM